MQTITIRSGTNIGIVLLLFGTFVGLDLTETLAAQSRQMAQAQCLGQLSRAVAQSTTTVGEEVLARAARSCARGDTRGALAALQSDSPVPPRTPDTEQPPPADQTAARDCLHQVSLEAKRRGIGPDSAAFQQARRYCASGDIRSALIILEKGQPAGDSAAQQRCLAQLEDYLRRRSLRPTDQSLARARRMCATSDFRQAVGVLEYPR